MNIKFRNRLLYCIYILLIIGTKVYSIEKLPRKHLELYLGMTFSEFSNLNFIIDEKMTKLRIPGQEGERIVYIIDRSNYKNVRTKLEFYFNKLVSISRAIFIKKDNMEFIKELTSKYGKPRKVVQLHFPKDLNEKEKLRKICKKKIKHISDLLLKEKRRKYINKYKNIIDIKKKYLETLEYDYKSYIYQWEDENTRLEIFLYYKGKDYKLEESLKNRADIFIEDIFLSKLKLNRLKEESNKQHQKSIKRQEKYYKTIKKLKDSGKELNEDEERFIKWWEKKR